jgi:hypothetical protein
MRRPPHFEAGAQPLDADRRTLPFEGAAEFWAD